MIRVGLPHSAHQGGGMGRNTSRTGRFHKSFPVARSTACTTSIHAVWLFLKSDRGSLATP